METKKDNKTYTAKPAASLALGIVSIVTAFFWYVSLPTGILAIVFGAKTARTMGSKLGKAGVITGIVGLSLFVLIYVSMIILVLLNNYY